MDPDSGLGPRFLVLSDINITTFLNYWIAKLSSTTKIVAIDWCCRKKFTKINKDIRDKPVKFLQKYMIQKALRSVIRIFNLCLLVQHCSYLWRKKRRSVLSNRLWGLFVEVWNVCWNLKLFLNLSASSLLLIVARITLTIFCQLQMKYLFIWILKSDEYFEIFCRHITKFVK